MDNMKIRKAQLEKLDDFVHKLYEETKVFGQYMNMKDLEILYLHIHELIQEMLQCKNSDEFMAMIEDLHRAVAGILIVAVPANAEQIKQDMEESHENFDNDAFAQMMDDIKNGSVQKNGGSAKKRSSSETVRKESPETEAKQKSQPTNSWDEDEEEVENDPDELIEMLELEDQVKQSKAKKKKKPDAFKNDPLGDFYKGYKK